MRSAAPHLRLVVPAPELPAVPPEPPTRALGELRLPGFMLAVFLVPLVGVAMGGRWGAGLTGFCTAGALLSGRALVRDLRRRPPDAARPPRP